MSTSKTQGLCLLRMLCISLGLLGLAVPTLGQTPTFSVIHAFSFSDGSCPIASITLGTNGNLYGMTFAGGAYYYGTVFKLTPDGQHTLLYSFRGGLDGYFPYSGLIQGKDGNFYGTTTGGGAYDKGTVFKVTPGGQHTVLYSFQGGLDGYIPFSSPIQATDGNFYGTTNHGGEYEEGTVFKLTPDGQHTVLYSFRGGLDGGGPTAGLIQGTDGNLYGTVPYGGAYARGTVFKITLDGVLTVLHAFQKGSDGANPQFGLIQGADGNFYGTTPAGGSQLGSDGSGYGTVFMMTPAGEVTILHAFQGMPDGALPWGELVQGTDGHLYGATMQGGNAGGTAEGLGTIFRVTPSKEETVLYSFQGGLDGNRPRAGLVQGLDGNFYGSASEGGQYIYYGTLFRLSGLYPLPVLTGFSPDACNAGGPAFTLTVQGTGFQPFSTINWNGAPLSTTYVSSSALKASIPAALIATSGTARITVVTGAGGGASNIKKLPIRTTTLKPVSVSLTKDSTTGAYVANITFQNTGYLSATNVLLKKANLGAATTSTVLPLSVGTIAAGATGTASLTFPSSAGTSGTAVRLTVSGTFTGGTFWYPLKLTLP